METFTMGNLRKPQATECNANVMNRVMYVN